MTRFRQLNKTGRVAAATTLVLATGMASLLVATVALAAPRTPTPAITSGPSGAAPSSSATFTFTDGASPVSFQCALDGGSFSSCTSPKAYTGLADGSHTFKVNATTPGKRVSNDATRTWTVDTRPPALSVTSPTNGAAYNTSGWRATCSGGGICGTATDAGAVAQVTVAIRQAATGSYWNGSSFSSPTAIFNPATGTTSWLYALGRPADGPYTASVRARDLLNNTTTQSDQVNVTFTVDTVAPAQPAFTAVPDDPTDKSTARFNWAASEPGLSYRCSLDGATPSSCPGAGIDYRDLEPGDHCLSLFARDAAGNVSPDTSYCWTVLISGGFKITGDTVDLLAPGVSSPVNLVIENPLDFAIEVTSVAITISPTSSNAACSTSTNFTVVHSLIGTATIAANSTSSLEDLGIDRRDWPLVRMENTNFNQDACKNATITLNFTGTAAKA